MRPFGFFLLGGGSYSVAEVSIADETLTTTSAGSATCEIVYTSTGTITKTSDEPLTDGNWMSGGGVASNYDIRVTPTFGTYSLGSDSTGVWLNLGSSRAWNVMRATPGGKTCSATVEIREAAAPFTVLDTATVVLTATAE